MEGFTLVDAGSGIVLLISAILAYSRGFVRELLSIAGWVAAAVAAFYFAPQVEPLIREVPVVSDIIGESCQLSIIAAFAVVLAGALIVVAIFTPLFAGAVQRSALGGLDQGLGFLFGVARGVVLILAALVVYAMVNVEIDMIEQSKTKEVLADSLASIQTVIEEDSEAGEESIAKWFQDKYNELTQTCEADRAQPDLPTVTTPGNNVGN